MNTPPPWSRLLSTQPQSVTSWPMCVCAQLAASMSAKQSEGPLRQSWEREHSKRHRPVVTRFTGPARVVGRWRNRLSRKRRGQS